MGGDTIYKTYILPIRPQDQPHARSLSRSAGRIYSKTVSTVKKIHRRKGIWLSEGILKRYIALFAEDMPLHSQSKQAAVEEYYQNLMSYFRARSTSEEARPPYRTKKYNKVVYKRAAITRKGDTLYFSNGREGQRLAIPAGELEGEVRYAELIYNSYKQEYQMHIILDIAPPALVEDRERVLSIDLGQIHPMVTFDGERTVIYNGGELNSFARFKNKELSRLSRKLARVQRYSPRWRKLMRAKRALLAKSRNKIKDVLRKYTSSLIGYCLQEGIGIIVIGELTGIREQIDYGTRLNQNLHQWVFRKLVKMLTFKAEFVGIEVEYIDESYTSQTCPRCGERNKPRVRSYRCLACGFEYHRDGVGAINIFRKYTGSGLVEGVLTSPAGVRYSAHMCCLAEWNTSPWAG